MNRPAGRDAVDPPVESRGSVRRRAGPSRWKIVVASLLILAGALVATRPTVAARAELAAVHLYRAVGSPVLSTMATCRYEPTCSRYAARVLEEETFWRANLLIAERLAFCSPVGAVLEVVGPASWGPRPIGQTAGGPEPAPVPGPVP